MYALSGTDLFCIVPRISLALEEEYDARILFPGQSRALGPGTKRLGTRGLGRMHRLGGVLGTYAQYLRRVPAQTKKKKKKRKKGGMMANSEGRAVTWIAWTSSDGYMECTDK
eukprot:1086565-Rhodomonas_salina.1